MDMRSETESHVRNILDTFSGADGGGDFMFFRWFTEEMDRRARTGDDAANKLLDVVRRFSRYIDTARKLSKEKDTHEG